MFRCKSNIIFRSKYNSIFNDHQGLTYGCGVENFKKLELFRQGQTMTVNDLIVKNCSCQRFYVC